MGDTRTAPDRAALAVVEVVFEAGFGVGPDGGRRHVHGHGLRAAVRRHRLAAFVVVAFGWSWAWWVPMVLVGAEVVARDPWPSQFPGLLGPLLAAVVVTGVADGRTGLLALGRGMTRVRLGARGWALAVAVPLAFLVAGVLASGGVRLDELDDVSGLPELGVAATWLVLVFVNGLGEETGWRGFLLPHLRRRHAFLPAAGWVTAVWAAWHLPLFGLLASYRGFSPFVAVGFVVGLGAGSVVLAHVFERTGGSILAVAAWHGTYNLAAAAGGDDLRAGVVTALVIAWAIAIARRASPEPTGW